MEFVCNVTATNVIYAYCTLLPYTTLFRSGKKAEATVVNEEIWNFAGKTGVINVDPGAMPLKCSCTAALKTDGKGTVVTYTWEVKATVPLIGGKIEKMAIADMDARFDEETRAAIALLKDYA